MEKELEQLAQQLVGHYGWMLIVGFFGLLFKEFIVSTIQGIYVMLGNDINNDDILYIIGATSPCCTSRNEAYYLLYD